MDAYLKEGGKEDGVKSINMSNCPTASRWIKFANSLRLRLAMRVSNVNKALAASEAKKHWKTLMVLLNHPQRTSKSPVKDIKPTSRCRRLGRDLHGSNNGFCFKRL